MNDPKATIQLVRMAMAAFSDVSVAVAKFESAVLRDDRQAQEDARAEAHAHLDSCLDLKADAIAQAQRNIEDQLE